MNGFALTLVMGLSGLIPSQATEIKTLPVLPVPLAVVASDGIEALRPTAAVPVQPVTTTALRPMAAAQVRKARASATAIFDNSVIIRKTRAVDVPQIARIIRSKNNRKEFGFVMNVELLDAVEKQKLGRKSGEMILTASKKGDVLGFAHAYHRHDGQTTLREIAVREDSQGRGLGKKLLERVVEAARQRGQVSIFLKTLADSSSNAFYRKMGFKRVGQSSGASRLVNEYRLKIAPDPR